MDVILICIHWYSAYPLSYRHIELMIVERGAPADHLLMNGWAIHFRRIIEETGSVNRGSTDVDIS